MPLSPMMQQYQRAKEAAGEALLLFRMGDFYELFHQDAKDAARLLGITLTTRDKHKQPGEGDGPVPMAGFPHHQLDPYLAKIIRAGRRAAVCEQVEDPKQAKGLVRREVTRVVTAGTVTDDALLDPAASNYLAAVCLGEDSAPAGLAWVEASTGRFYASAVPRPQLADELTRIGAAECLVAETLEQALPAEVGERLAVTTRPAWAFGAESAEAALAAQFGAKSLEGFGLDRSRPGHTQAIAAAGAVLDYLQETQKASLAHVERISLVEPSSCLQIDAATWRSLEVTSTLRDGRREGSLLGVMDRTATPMGARLLAEWLRRPLTDPAAITARLDAVGELVDHGALSADVREELRGVYDLQRLVARVTTGRASPRDLSFVARTLARLPKLKAKLTGRASDRLVAIEGRIDLCPDVRSRLEAALADDCPQSPGAGGFIRPGYDGTLDECRELMAGGKQWMARYQAEEQERTGIPSIKVGFNKVFGYYLEVTHAHRDKVPDEYLRKQTLKNAERYITPELKEYEEKVLSAEDRAIQIELRIFAELRDLVAAAGSRLLAAADALAELDVLAGLAELARSRNYARPNVVDDPVVNIQAGRHPVLDVTEPEGSFVANDVACDAAKGARSEGPGTREGSEAESPWPLAPGPSLLLITGPNMAGKSTYIRQTALITLMAQAGSFVPAERATIGVADKLFARVGASDDVSRGQSTFMVEMVETARILNTATRRSLVILDEVGRGTSTYDGLSLAWAIVEHLHNSIGCRTLFATHYHELTSLAGPLPGVANRSVAVQEHEGRVVFLHRIVERPADKSYGIHVAELAGVPKAVNQRAAEVLADLETKADSDAPRQPGIAAGGGSLQLTLFETADHPVVEELRTLDLNNLTPLDAHRLLAEWRERV
ncbi:MAG: DNA mismatch repair protein MutS [Planctomycetota bacterium]